MCLCDLCQRATTTTTTLKNAHTHTHTKPRKPQIAPQIVSEQADFRSGSMEAQKGNKPTEFTFCVCTTTKSHALFTSRRARATKSKRFFFERKRKAKVKFWLTFALLHTHTTYVRTFLVCFPPLCLLVFFLSLSRRTHEKNGRRFAPPIVRLIDGVISSSSSSSVACELITTTTTIRSAAAASKGTIGGTRQNSQGVLFAVEKKEYAGGSARWASQSNLRARARAMIDLLVRATHFSF